jgi:hypothetical protein
MSKKTNPVIETTATEIAEQVNMFESKAAKPPNAGDSPPAGTAHTAKSSSSNASKSDLFDGDVLDLQKFALPTNYGESLGVKKALLTVPCRKPQKQEWVCIHPDPTFHHPANLFEDKLEKGEMYLVAPGLDTELQGEVLPYILYTAMTRQGVCFLWPVRLPRDDERASTWHDSARSCAAAAKKGWVRVAANMNLGAYDLYETLADWPEPKWPDVSLAKLITLAFKGRILDSVDHPVVARLRGIR